MMITSLGTVVVSLALSACLALVVTSCTACSKFLQKRKQKKSDQKKDEEKAEIAMEEADGGKTGEDEEEDSGKGKENGVTNVAFESHPPEDGEDKGQKKANGDAPAADGSQDEDQGKESEDTSEQENTKVPDSVHTEDESKPQSQEVNSKLESDNAQVHGDCPPGHYCDGPEDAFHDETHPGDPRSPQTHRDSIPNFSLRPSDVEDFSYVVGGCECQDSIAEESASTQDAALPSNILTEEDDLSRFDGVLIRGGWRRSVKLRDLLDLKLIDSRTADSVKKTLEELNDEEQKSTVPVDLKPILVGKSPIAGILVSETGDKQSVYRAAKEGIIRRGTAISLLEAQAATGSIIDPLTGRKMSVTEASQLGLLDKVYETVVSRAERAVTGYKSRVSEDVLSLGQAMERGLVMESHGVRLLEAQLATGGIIDHKINARLPLDVAVERGLLDRRVADIVAAACADKPMEELGGELKTFFDPNTEENVTYSELMRRSMVDADTGMRLYPLEKIGKGRYNYSGHSGRSSLASSRASSRESIPAAVAASSP